MRTISIALLLMSAYSFAQHDQIAFYPIIEGVRALPIEEKIIFYQRLVEILPVHTQRAKDVLDKDDLANALLEKEHGILLGLMDRVHGHDIDSIWGAAARTKKPEAKYFLIQMLATDDSDKRIYATRFLSMYFNKDADVFQALEKLESIEQDVDVLWEILSSMQYFPCSQGKNILQKYASNARQRSGVESSYFIPASPLPPYYDLTLEAIARSLIKRCDE